MIKINQDFIRQTSDKAKTSARKRMNYNFHKEDAATLQRMLNAIEPDSYIRPHKHENPDKVEAFFVLKGKMAVIEFDDSGEIVDYIILDSSLGNFGCEIPARTWHSIISLEIGSVAYEVKDGPYNPIDDKNFASWAPVEGHENTLDYLHAILRKLNLRAE